MVHENGNKQILANTLNETRPFKTRILAFLTVHANGLYDKKNFNLIVNCHKDGSVKISFHLELENCYHQTPHLTYLARNGSGVISNTAITKNLNKVQVNT